MTDKELAHCQVNLTKRIFAWGGGEEEQLLIKNLEIQNNSNKRNRPK